MPPSLLSRRQQQIMDIVYARGQATVRQVAEALPDAPSTTSIRAMMLILMDLGHLRQKKIGRENAYLPTRPRRQAGQTALRRVVDTFFKGSLHKAVAAHLADSKLSPEELRQLRELIETQEHERGSG